MRRAVLNVAPDHVDWHGVLEAYAADKGRAYANTEVACVYNVADPATERLVERGRRRRTAAVRSASRSASPAPGMLGVVDDFLVDRAFIEDRTDDAAELASVSDVVPFAPHNVANALAAAALARAYGVPACCRTRRAARLPSRRAPDRARGRRSAASTYVDDSKATNPHAAAASLAAYDSVVWVAGGLAKGADFDDLVRRAVEPAARRRAARRRPRD